MIEFFLSPARVKGLIVGGGVALLIIAALFTSTLYFSGKLDTEMANHRLTAQERDVAVIEGVRWKAVADAAPPKIAALQEGLRECLTRETQAQVNVAERADIMREVQPQVRTETEQQGVVDSGTRSKAMHRLNRPL